MRKFLILTGMVCFLCSPLAWAKTDDRIIDARASSIRFSGKSTLHDFHGKAGTVSGRLTFPQGSLVAAGEAAVPILSLGTGNRTMDKNMYAMFEAKTFPEISFKISSVDLSGAREGGNIQVVARGVLTMHGVSREVSVPVKVRLDQGRYVCEGDFPVSLKDFKLKAPRMLFIKVADQVWVHFSAVYVLQ